MLASKAPPWLAMAMRVVVEAARFVARHAQLARVLELVTAYGGQVTIEDSDLGGASIRVDIPAA